MERTKKQNDQVQETGEIHWKKIGGGSFRHKGKIIKPGQTFLAKPEEIPATFRNVIIPLDNVPTPSKPYAPSVKKPEKPAYTKVEVAKEDLDSTFDPEQKWWNVKNASGKVINQLPLSDEKATALINDLN